MRLLVLAAVVLALASRPAHAQTCGDFVREVPEQCDDGNTRNLDGCDALCRFELVHRVDALKLQGGVDASCAANVFGAAFTPAGLTLAQANLDNSVLQGATGVMFQLLGLDDPAGGDDPALEVGVLSGAPIEHAAPYDGTEDPDGWYAADKTLLDGQRLPAHRLPASLAAGVLAAGPGTATVRIVLGAVPAALSFTSLTIGVTTGPSSLPAAWAGASPGHLAYEHLDAALASVATMGVAGASEGTLCGHIGAASLAQTPIPPLLTEICGEGYTLANSLLDVLVGGCLEVPVLFPAQPDQQVPAAPAAGAGPPYTLLVDPGTLAVAACTDSSDVEVDLATCLADAAFSAHFKFTTERVVAFDDRILDDSFESGDVSAWSLASGFGDSLSVSAAAAMAGTGLGLLGAVDDTDPLFVQDDSPEDENRYRARFYLDPTGFDPGEANGKRRTRVFVAFADGPRRLSAIVLRRLNGAYALMGRARRDDGSQADTAWVPIAAGPHRVELDWIRASGPDQNDGRFRLWVDGALAGDLAGLDNSLDAVDFARLGALSVKPGASGPLRWDHFQSNRASASE